VISFEKRKQMLKTANIFMTGGAGTLGKAIAKRRKQERWTGKLTVLSTDAGKHSAMRALYPDVNYIQGDIRNGEALKLAMSGHDVVIHAAAVKFIPDSEFASIDTIDVNVYGSEVVCDAARWAGIEQVCGISTDKACHPANAYGASKMLMEKVFQEHARYGGDTIFTLVRYGNVLESRGSVVEAWHRAMEEGKPVRITDESMTRFWLSPSQAVDHVVETMELGANGLIYVAKMPSLSIGRMLEYVAGGSKCQVVKIPMRPGEKLHEILLTVEETEYARDMGDHFILHPSTAPRFETDDPPLTYTSEFARELSKEELYELLKG